MQEPTGAFGGRGKLLFWLMGINVGVFLLQVILGASTGYQVLEHWFGLSGDSIKRFFLWTPFTYSFLHSTRDILHVVVNMIGLFVFWQALEDRLGQERLLQLFVFSVLGGALLYLAVWFNVRNASVIGASAGVFGLLTVFCLMYPERQITILLMFIIPVTIKPKYLLMISGAVTVLGFLVYELVPILSGELTRGGVSHSAHLGGMVMAFVYMRTMMDKAPIRMDRPSVKLPDWVKRKDDITKRAPDYTVNLGNRKELSAEINRILDKINRSGFQSLTTEERQTLDRGSDLMR